MSQTKNEFAVNRRMFLNNCAGGIGSLALAHLLSADAAVSSDAGRGRNSLAVRSPHDQPRAQSVICLFQNGGPSQVDLFDPKPELTRLHGKPYPGKLDAHFDKQIRNLLASPFHFHHAGRCGMQLSELLPNTASMADELTLIRSMKTGSVDHEQALRLIHSGKAFAGRPAWGSWVIYALGSQRDDLPAYVVLTDPAGLPIDGTKNWSSGFLPAVYQGTQFRSTGSPVLNLKRPGDLSPEGRRNQLEFLHDLNAAHLRRHPENSELQARISNYELAARMQTSVPQVLDISDETKQTRTLYGLDNPTTADYGRRCLMARRLVEQGVRFVQVFLNSQPWDTHSKNAESLKKLCARIDQPSAALLADLRHRGLLETTIVIWAGEFGRLPVSQGPDGRDHNRHAFSLWLAGGGFKAGHVHGETDEFGYKSVKDVVRVHDLHATLLSALGLDHAELTYPHEGRDDTLTDMLVTDAQVVPELLS